MNKVILIGRLAKDPELRYTLSNKAYVRFTLAVDRGNTKDGKDLGADFVNCFAWEKKAEVIAKYIKKGNRLGVYGQIRVTSSELENGSKKYFTEVQVYEIEFLENKSKEETVPYGEPTTSAEFAETVQSSAEDPFADFGEEINPDDLPF